MTSGVRGKKHLSSSQSLSYPMHPGSLPRKLIHLCCHSSRRSRCIQDQGMALSPGQTWLGTMTMNWLQMFFVFQHLWTKIVALYTMTWRVHSHSCQSKAAFAFHTLPLWVKLNPHDTNHRPGQCDNLQCLQVAIWALYIERLQAQIKCYGQSSNKTHQNVSYQSRL